MALKIAPIVVLGETFYFRRIRISSRGSGDKVDCQRWEVRHRLLVLGDPLPLRHTAKVYELTDDSLSDLLGGVVSGVRHTNEL